jgi:hypothetical protein
LASLGVEQDRAAMAASVIDGMIARPQDRRSIHDSTGGRRNDDFQADLWRGHYPVPVNSPPARCDNSHSDDELAMKRLEQCCDGVATPKANGRGLGVTT